MTQMSERVVIGTRGSVLALWQAEHVKALIAARHQAVTVEIRTIKTQGDIIQNVALAALPGKAFFTKEIEDALLSGSVDIAVHSGKDLPTSLPEGLLLAGFLKRHIPLDAWLSAGGATLETLPAGARVGTSSLRRRALIASLRPDLALRDLRGNVDTRMRKLREGQFDAIVLAAAGLERLGLLDRVTELLDPRRFPPAVSQGAIALEIRLDDPVTAALLDPLVDEETTVAVRAERALLERLEGGCQVPLGALATVKEGRLSLFASLLSPDGVQRFDGTESGPPNRAEPVGVALADALVAQGGQGVLEAIRKDELHC